MGGGSGGDGFDAQLSALEAGAGQLSGQGATLGGLGGQASGAASTAAGGVLGGPLAGALNALGTEIQTRSENLARALAAASASVQNCATTYQQQDAEASSAVMASVADMGRDAPQLAALTGSVLAPQAPPDPNAPPLPLPGFTSGSPAS